MRISTALSLLFVFCVPFFVFAQDSKISRRDGFLLIWETVKRPAVETSETPFLDVPEGSKGFLEITYAKRRGLLDTGETFLPDDPLTIGDAFLMLLRTRNVDDNDNLTRDNLTTYIDHYHLAQIPSSEHSTLNKELTREELTTLITAFDTFLKEEPHESSLYSEKFHGKGTAFGESFDMNAMTAAHRTFPHNTLIKVTNIENGKSVTVRINDRGPFVVGRDLDLSLGAFTTIAERSKGKIMVRIERLGDVSLVGDLTTGASASSQPSSFAACGNSTAAQIKVGRNAQVIDGLSRKIGLGNSLTLTSKKSFVVHQIIHPDGKRESISDWILSTENYSFQPALEGRYMLILGSESGGRKRLRVVVSKC